MSADVVSGPEFQQHPSPGSSESDAPVQSRWLQRLILLVGAAVIVAVAVVLLPKSGSDGPGKLTHTIRKGDLIVAVTEQGTLESANNTEIKCDVRGYSVVTFVVDGGSIVKEGDVLVTLDTKSIEEALSMAKTEMHQAKATLAETTANVAKGKISIEAYQQGRYLAELKELDRQLDIATTNWETAEKMLKQSEALFKQGFVTQLEVAGNRFTVRQAELELNVKKTEKNVLQTYTRKMRLATLNGNLTASKSKLQADEAGLKMEISRRDRAQKELESCVIKAKRSGMVIYPSAAVWKNSPDIAEGATVRKDQVLLLMPDLTQMQVKVGVHESIVDRVKEGQKATVTLPDRTLEAEVSKVAKVTRPAGWWTGNVVKYDTIIKLPSDEGLKPGMSAEVKVILAEHRDILLIPVAAVVESMEGDFCWVIDENGNELRRLLQLGDSNDVFIAVKSGLKEGDKVVLNPTTELDDKEAKAVRQRKKRKSRKELSPAKKSPQS